MFRIGTFVTCDDSLATYQIFEKLERAGKPTLYKLRWELPSCSEYIWEVMEEQMKPTTCKGCALLNCDLKNKFVVLAGQCGLFRKKK